MKTQIAITVKDETIISKALTLFWFINIFKKSKLIVSIDGNTYECKASKTPYIFDVTPGNHVIEIYDPKAKQKSRTRAMTGALIGGTVGFTGGGFAATAMGTMVGAQAMNLNIQNGVVNCTLSDGDILRLSCKGNSKGAVKIQPIK